MSMHEFEDLVEMSVKVLAKSKLSQGRLRSLYFNLFELEACFDTDFTHFRTMNELLAARFVYRIPVREHPDFAEHVSYFESLSTFCFVQPPGRDRDDSYFDPPYVYCDAGSKLWRRLVERGALTHADALAPDCLPLQEVLLEVARHAEHAGDRLLVAYCYRLLLWALLDCEPEELAGDPCITALRRIVGRTEALALTLDHGCLRDPTAADLAEHAIVRYWFDLSDVAAPVAQQRRA